MAAANELVARLGEMKGAAMNIGQVLSTVDFDLIPAGEREQFKEKLAELRDDAPRVPFAKQRNEIEAQNQRAVGRAFRGHPHIRVPGVDTALSTRRVLVTEYVEGRPFSAVKQLLEADRDRFAEISFRFFFGLLTREGIAAGDPHPGNFLLAPDEKVVFPDFGLIRHVEPEYLEGERALARAVMARDAAQVKRSMAELGYLPEPAGFDGDDLLAQLLIAAEWYFAPGFRRLDSEYVRLTLEQGSSPRSAFFGQMRRQTVPPQALLIRRMEGLLFAVYGELRAGAHWHDLAREYLAGAPPSTELGEIERGWLTGAPTTLAA